MKKLLVLSSLGLLSACSSGTTTKPVIDDKTITYNDFEAGGGWSNNPGGNDPTAVAKGQAHSGQYAIKVDNNREYSLTFAMPLGKISSSKFKTLHFEAWAFMPTDKATANIGLQIINPDGQPAYGDGLRLRDVVKSYGKWMPISKNFVLPDNITANQQLRLFLWRADASDEALLDDVKLSIKD